MTVPRPGPHPGRVFKAAPDHGRILMSLKAILGDFASQRSVSAMQAIVTHNFTIHQKPRFPPNQYPLEILYGWALLYCIETRQKLTAVEWRDQLERTGFPFGRKPQDRLYFAGMARRDEEIKKQLD